MKEIVLDTETTGISIKEGHRIVEIGCIELEDLVPTNNKFHYYLNPERKVSEKALAIHGYTDEFLLNKKKFRDISDEFQEFIKDKKYSKALQSETPMKYLQAIKDAGYATDQSYVQTVGDVYQQYKNAGIFN